MMSTVRNIAYHPVEAVHSDGKTTTKFKPLEVVDVPEDQVQRFIDRYPNMIVEYKEKEVEPLKEDKTIKIDKLDFACDICGKEESNGFDLAVDHNHKTGKIRGLLCRKCNTGIGLFQDSTELLAKAIEYLH